MCRRRQREAANEGAVLRHDGATNEPRWSQRPAEGLGMKVVSPAPQRGQGQAVFRFTQIGSSALTAETLFFPPTGSSVGDGWLLPHFSLRSHQWQINKPGFVSESERSSPPRHPDVSFWMTQRKKWRQDRNLMPSREKLHICLFQPQLHNVAATRSSQTR